MTDSRTDGFDVGGRVGSLTWWRRKACRTRCAPGGRRVEGELPDEDLSAERGGVEARHPDAAGVVAGCGPPPRLADMSGRQSVSSTDF